MNWESIAAAIGVIGGIAGVISAAVVAHHRTRGARRMLAARLTRDALVLYQQVGASPNDLASLRGDLFAFYFKMIRNAEERGDSTELATL